MLFFLSVGNSGLTARPSTWCYMHIALNKLYQRIKWKNKKKSNKKWAGLQTVTFCKLINENQRIYENRDCDVTL